MLKLQTSIFAKLLSTALTLAASLTEYEVVDVFITQADSDLRISPNPEEVMDFEWVEFADLRKRIADTPDVFTPWLRIYMADFAETIFGADFGTR